MGIDAVMPVVGIAVIEKRDGDHDAQRDHKGKGEHGGYGHEGMGLGSAPPPRAVSKRGPCCMAGSRMPRCHHVRRLRLAADRASRASVRRLRALDRTHWSLPSSLASTPQGMQSVWNLA